MVIGDLIWLFSANSIPLILHGYLAKVNNGRLRPTLAQFCTVCVRSDVFHLEYQERDESEVYLRR